MAIPCPRCGREYDVTLFAFGRTLDCTCGERVALELRRSLPERPLRFVADEMLGRLARWLRALGYDTLHTPGVEDAALVRAAFLEQRLLLTRDQRLCRDWRFDGCMVVVSPRPAAQLRELRDRLGVGRDWPARLFTRCMICNTLLAQVAERGMEPAGGPGPDIEAEAAALHGRTPPLGAAVQSYCPGCGRIYWEGQHSRRMRAFLERVLGSA